MNVKVFMSEKKLAKYKKEVEMYKQAKQLAHDVSQVINFGRSGDFYVTPQPRKIVKIALKELKSDYPYLKFSKRLTTVVLGYTKEMDFAWKISWKVVRKNYED